MNIKWMSARRFIADGKWARARLVERYERVVSRLLQRQLLTEEEARQLPAQVEIRVFDERKNRVPPLPAVER